MVRNIQVHDTFSGPLDLLLYLVRRDEIDIHDIPVGHVTKEYLVELNKMQEIDVDAGGEFLAMASMLTEIKGRMLLPDIKEEEEEDELYDPRQGLVEALLEYKKFKEVAAELEAMSEQFDIRYGRNVTVPEFQAVIKEKAEDLGALDLLAAFQRIARKMLNERAPREIVSEEVPTEIRIQQIEDIVSLRGRVSFTSILSDSPSEDEMVGFFIAMLELVRMKKIIAQQAVDFSEIYFVALDEHNERESWIEEEVEAREEGIEKIHTVSSRRIVCLGLSNAFGVKKNNNRRTDISNGAEFKCYNMFSMLKKPISEVRQKITRGHDFPPLLHNYSVPASNNNLPECIEKPSIVISDACIDTVSGKNQLSVSVNKCRASVKIAEVFSLVNSKKEGSSKIKSYNKFDMLGLRKVIFAGSDKKNIRVNNFEFMRLLTGRICKHNIQSINNSVELLAARDAAGILLDNTCSKITAKIKMSLAEPFALGLKSKVLADVNNHQNRFDMLRLRGSAAVENNAKMRITGKLGFMRISTGKVMKNVVEAIPHNKINVVMDEENKILQSNTDNIVRKNHMTLANPFRMLCRPSLIAGSFSGKICNKYDMLSWSGKKNNSAAITKINQSMVFLPLGVGRINIYSPGNNNIEVIDSGLAAAESQHNIECINKQGYERNKFKLSSAFSMGNAFVNNSQEPLKTDFDFMSSKKIKPLIVKKKRGFL